VPRHERTLASIVDAASVLNESNNRGARLSSLVGDADAPTSRERGALRKCREILFQSRDEIKRGNEGTKARAPRQRARETDETLADADDHDGIGLARDTRRTEFRDNFISTRTAVYVRNAIAAVRHIRGVVSHARLRYSNSRRFVSAIARWI